MSNLTRLVKRLQISESEARHLAKSVQKVVRGVSFDQIAECLELCPTVSAASLTPERVRRLLSFITPSHMIWPLNEEELRQFPIMVSAAMRLNLSEMKTEGLFMQTQMLFHIGTGVPSFHTIAIAIVSCPHTIELTEKSTPKDIAGLVIAMRRGDWARQPFEQPQPRKRLSPQSPRHQPKRKSKRSQRSSHPKRRIGSDWVRARKKGMMSTAHIPPGFTRREWEGDWTSD